MSMCPICGRPSRCACIPTGYVYLDVDFDSGPSGILVPVGKAGVYIAALVAKELGLEPGAVTYDEGTFNQPDA